MPANQESRMRRALVAVDPKRLGALGLDRSHHANRDETRLHERRLVILLLEAVLPIPAGLIPPVRDVELRRSFPRGSKASVDRVRELRYEADVRTHDHGTRVLR